MTFMGGGLLVVGGMIADDSISHWSGAEDWAGMVDL